MRGYGTGRAGVRRPGFWIRLCVVVIRPLDRLLFRLRWRGTENVPATGGVLLVANHVSYADPLTFVRFVWDCGRVPRILVKSSLFRMPFVGSVMRGARQIPVDRGSSSAHAALDAGLAALRSGEAVCVYPEGTVTRDPRWWPMQAKTGVARLALASGVPVIPIAQWGAQSFYDRYGGVFRPLPRKRIDMAAGRPVDLSAYRGQELSSELLRSATDHIMRAVRDLLAGIRGEQPPEEFWPRPPHEEDPEKT